MLRFLFVRVWGRKGENNVFILDKKEYVI
jgi:hypothetical protein